MSDPNQKRANKLSAISFAIIIYVIAGGSFENAGSFMGGAIGFEHPNYLKYAFLILFCYYFYKYWLVIRNPLLRFHAAIKSKLKQSKEGFYYNYVQKKFVDFINRKIENNEPFLGRYWDTVSSDKKPSKCKITNQSIAKPLLVRKGTTLLVKVEVQDKHKRDITFLDNKFLEVPITIWGYSFYYIVESLRFIFFEDRFSNEFYPYILSTGAIIAIIYKAMVEL